MFMVQGKHSTNIVFLFGPSFPSNLVVLFVSDGNSDTSTECVMVQLIHKVWLSRNIRVVVLYRDGNQH